MRPPRIQVLPAELSEQIAAGEVIERPASVVKELLENSLDAGARRIVVDTEGGGREWIRVADDGEGMTPEEAELALLRHATSKLRTADDLFRISTLGFRGEALPTIAAVAEMEISTRQEDVAEGTRLRVIAGRLVDSGSAAAPPGTTVAVSRLFFNVPARQKFMKSPAAEAGQITEVMLRLALAHPEVAFTLRHDGKVALQSPGSPAALNSVVALLGREVARDLVPVSTGGEGQPSVTGFAGLPTLSRATRAQQHFFVNGRPVRSPLFYRALDDVYRARMPANRRAVALIFLRIDPADVDVNVHPAKFEVRFRDEAAVHAAITRAVDQGLAGRGAAPEPARVEPAPAAAAGAAESTPPSGPPQGLPFAAAAMARAAASFRPAPPAPREPGSAGERGSASPAAVPRPAASPPAPAARADAPPPLAEPAVGLPGPEPAAPGIQPLEPPRSPIPPLRLLGQSEDLFILAEGDGKLWVIDQHVAHERILFERLVLGAEPAAPGDEAAGVVREPVELYEVGDPLLLPLTLELDPRQELAVMEHLALLADLGFSIEPFGARRIQVRAVPRSLAGRNYEMALTDMIDELADLSQGGRIRLRREQLAMAAAGRACKAAVKAGMPLSAAEMTRLLEELARTRNPYTCPHGRPVFLTFEAADLEQRFGPRQCVSPS